MKRRSRPGIPIRGILPLVVFLVAWQFFGSSSSSYFPRPSTWVTADRELFHEGGLLGAIELTALSFVLGLLLAAIIGSALGILVGSSRTADRALGPLLEFLRVMPAAVLVPFGTLLLGYNLEMKLVVIVLTTTWPVLLAVRAGRRAMTGTILDVAPNLGLSRIETLRKVVLPGLFPNLLNGLSVAAPLCLIVTLLVEMIARVGGIGSLIGSAQDTFDSRSVYGLLVIAGILAVIVNQLVRRVDIMFRRRIGTLGDQH